MHPYLVTALVVLSGWLLYSWFRPLTPREICDRFNQAQTPEEMSKYATLNLQPALEAMSRLGDSDQNDDPYEYTRDGVALNAVGGYLVGVRTNLFIPEAGRKVRIDAVIHLVDNDGWKVEDLYFCAFDHQPLGQAISLARDYSLLLNPPDTEPDPASFPAPTVAAQQIKLWFDSGRSQKKASWLSGLVGTLTSGISQGICIVLIVVCLGIAHFSKQRQGAIRHPSQHMRTGF